jgi:hypothetical protein
MELAPHDPAGQVAAPEGGREVDQTEQARRQGGEVLHAGPRPAEVEEPHWFEMGPALA